jgi:hypothetical protein
LLLRTVTRSEIGAGEPPATALPKLSDDRSSARESTGSISMSTVASSLSPGAGGGGGVPSQG